MQVAVHWITLILLKILSAYVDSLQLTEFIGRYEPQLRVAITNMLQSMVHMMTILAVRVESAPHSLLTETHQ